MKKLTLCALALAMLACESKKPMPTATFTQADTEALLQAISIVDENTTWVSGHKATFLRTKDGGQSWETFQYAQADSLQFRDLHAFDAENIILMSAGPGKKSQILLFNPATGYELTYLMEDSLGFLNTIEFWDSEKGLAFGDSYNGQLFIMKTVDGGKSWTRVDPATLPAAGEGEGGFAASGTCIATRPGGKAWIGTGAGGNSRVLYTADYGSSWAEYPVPTIKGDAAGITSIHMITDDIGSIVGGDLAITDAYTNNIATTTDGGKTWQLAGQPITKGAFYGSDLISAGDGYLLIASGPNGIDYSLDFGKSFVNLDTTNYWAVNLTEQGFGFATGPKGKILKIQY